MLKFSFLIPVYNGEKYLGRLFKSLLSQDIPYEEYEIVCADDCSSDKSIKLIEKYQQTYPNFRLIKNKVNCRIATNVNILVDAAKGQYLWLLGQDDYIEENCLNTLYERLEHDGLDVLVFNYRHVRDDESTIAEHRIVTDTPRMKGVDWIKQQFDKRDYCQYILGYEWRAIFRTDFWREKHIRCVDGMMYEDTVILLKALVYSDAVASSNIILHNYRMNDNSITYRSNFVKRGDLIYEFAFMVGKEVEDFYNELKEIDATLATNLYAHLLKRYNNFVFDLIRTPNEHKRVFYKYIREHHDFVESKWHYLNWKSRLFVNRIFGYPLACICYYGYKFFKQIRRTR